MSIEASSNDRATRAEGLKQRGNTAYAARNFNEAIKQYSHAIVIQPSNPIFYANRAAAWMALKRWREAEYDCRTALELDPTVSKAKARIQTIEKERATAPDTTQFTLEHSIPYIPPTDHVELRSDLPGGKHSGLFTRRDILPGEEIFAASAAGVAFERDCTDGRITTDLLHEVLIQATIDPSIHRSLWSLYPNTDHHLIGLPLISLHDACPEEAELFEQRCAAHPSIHPTLILPDYSRFVRLTCGRFTPKQIHLLHHQVLCDSWSLNHRGGTTPGERGEALYPLAAKLNHSCWPNATLSILEGQEHRAVVRSIRAIPKGQEITVCYRANTMARPRNTRRRVLAEVFDFVCQCDRCMRGSSSEGSACSQAASSAAVVPGTTADDLLESIFCLSPTCAGSLGTPGVKGTMLRVFNEASPLPNSVDPLVHLAGERVREYFLCRDCKSKSSVSDVSSLVDALDQEFERITQQYHSSPDDVDKSIASFSSLLERAEKLVIQPAHHLLPPIYSALGGLFFRRAMRQPIAALDQRLAAMDQARNYASAAYHGSQRVLPDGSEQLIPLLLTLAACCDGSRSNARLDCVREAARIHELNHSDGVALFQARFAKDLERLQITRDAMETLPSKDET